MENLLQRKELEVKLKKMFHRNRTRYLFEHFTAQVTKIKPVYRNRLVTSV